tara:strand:+ start:561 stop:878 length:318 start_codon:yes stop_codon:yes gene_type:complete
MDIGKEDEKKEEVRKMNNETKRKRRINSLWVEIAKHVEVEYEPFISYCSVQYGLSRRTTREYLTNLAHQGLIKIKDGGFIRCIKKPKNKQEKQTREFDKLLKQLQ